MAGIRKREIVGFTFLVALFGAVASPAFALTADLGQTSVSTDTAANLVQGGSTGSSPTSGGGDAVPDLGKAVTDTSGASPQTNVDATPATGSGTGEPAAQTGSTSPPLEQRSAQAPSGAGGTAVTDLGNAAGQATGAEPQPQADPAPVARAPKAVTSLTSTAPKVVDAVQKDASTIAGAGAGGGAPADATGTLTDTAAMLTQDPVGTAPALVDAVQKDVSTVVGIVAGGGTPPAPGVPGGGGLLGLGGAITYVNQALDPVIAILKDPVRPVSATVQQLLPASTGLLDLSAPGSQPPIVSGVTSSLGAPIVPISESPLSRQLRFAGSSPGPGQPLPGAHTGGAEPAAANRPSDAPPARFFAGLLPSEQVIARGFVANPTHSGATARRATSGAGTMSVDGISLSIRSLPLLGVGSGSSSAGDRSGAPFPKLPGAPPQPELPALGGMSSSTLLSFGSFTAVAVMLASIAARSGFIRRLALARRRPVGFALLLERPG
jgi:hypothetical protein